MTLAGALATTAGFAFAAMFALWLVSLAKRNASIAS